MFSRSYGLELHGLVYCGFCNLLVIRICVKVFGFLVGFVVV